VGRPSKLTPEQWAIARRRWEGCAVPGFEWLRKECLAAFGDAPSRPAMQQMAGDQKWAKGGETSLPIPPMAAPAPAKAGQGKPAATDAKPTGKATGKSRSAAGKAVQGGQLVTRPSEKVTDPEGEKVTSPEQASQDGQNEVADEVVDGRPAQRRGPGRPTKYRPEFAEQIVTYFDVQPEEDVKVEQPNGLVKLQRMARVPPMLVGFARSIGIDLTTLNRWATDVDAASGKPRHPDFADAYAHARELHESLIAKGALLGLYDSKASQFLLKNLHGWQDQPARKVAVAPVSKDELEAKFGARMAAAHARMQELLAERRDLLANDPGDDE
jgi:hypothetical protein